MIFLLMRRVSVLNHVFCLSHIKLTFGSGLKEVLTQIYVFRNNFFQITQFRNIFGPRPLDSGIIVFPQETTNNLGNELKPHYEQTFT